MHIEDDEDDLGALFDQTGNVRDDAPAKAGHNRGVEEDDALDDMSFDDIMREARKDLLTTLLRDVRHGMATPADRNTLRQLLKDNGMVMGDPSEGARQSDDKTKAPLPSFTRPDYE